MNSRGGSEIMLDYLNAYVDTSKFNIILSDCDYLNFDSKKKNILWQQCSYDQPNVQATKDKSFQDHIAQFVYVSHWQFERFRLIHNTPKDKSIVIKNAVVPIEKHEKPRGKLRLVYTSTPFRGLDVLLDALEIMKRKDIEVDIYSSTIIYGDDYHERYEREFEPLFRRAKQIANYKGYVTNETLKENLKQAHIFAYPNTWEETSCISAIEALSAGLKIVTTNNGALPETCGEFATYVNYEESKVGLARAYAKALNAAIDNYWSEQEELKMQVDFAHKYYSWDRRKLEWEAMLKKL